MKAFSLQSATRWKSPAARVLRDFDAKTGISLVAFKAKDQFNFVDTPKQTGVNSVNEIREIDSRFGLPGPAAGGTQKLIQFCVAHEHLGGCGFPVYHAAILAEMVFDSHQVKPE